MTTLFMFGLLATVTGLGFTVSGLTLSQHRVAVPLLFLGVAFCAAGVVLHVVNLVGLIL